LLIDVPTLNADRAFFPARDRIIIGSGVDLGNGATAFFRVFVPEDLRRRGQEGHGVSGTHPGSWARIGVSFRDPTAFGKVREFHRQLVGNRVARFAQEHRHLERELATMDRSICDLNDALNEKTAFLCRSRALDYFVSVGNEIAILKAKAQKLQDYRALGRRWSDKQATTKAALQQEVLRTNEYLAQIHPRLEEINGVFEALSRRLYPDSPTGLTLRNNDRENQIRFYFDVRIENDASDGINEPHLLKSVPITTDGVEANGRGDTEQAVRAAVRRGGPGEDSPRDCGGETAVSIADRATGMPGAGLDRRIGRPKRQ